MLHLFGGAAEGYIKVYTLDLLWEQNAQTLFQRHAEYEDEW